MPINLKVHAQILIQGSKPIYIRLILKKNHRGISLRTNIYYPKSVIFIFNVMYLP